MTYSDPESCTLLDLVMLVIDEAKQTSVVPRTALEHSDNPNLWADVDYMFS